MLTRLKIIYSAMLKYDVTPSYIKSRPDDFSPIVMLQMKFIDIDLDDILNIILKYDISPGPQTVIFCKPEPESV